MKRINLIIICVSFLGVFASCSFDSKNKELKENRVHPSLTKIDSDSNKASNSKDNEVNGLTFEFRLLNDSVGRYFSKGDDFLKFISTDNSGNIPYDTAMHYYLDIDGAGCYADKDERYTFIETPIRLNVFDGIKFITSITDYNIFIIPNSQIGDKEFLAIFDSAGLIKSFIEIKHSVRTKYCTAKRNYKIGENLANFTIEFQDYVSRKEPDFTNEINGILLVDELGRIVIKYNENTE
ncbi:hypothetical protein [Xanthovirga aplysinae]|uniref:hypothetical protein n=1 Tax=Xanthovirga aplysinae TaxID=2529853 RepID=UPI0012BB9404|nr:hypothetical protein [Xanthovirga aplysinae]MTI31190.1 hypothetical protein [Xanthovirga aplysinae]